MTDPFTLVHQSIWTALAASQSWTGYVKSWARNNQTVASYQQGMTANPSAAELPEVMLIQAEFMLWPFGSNSVTSDFEQTYYLICTSDYLSVLQINAVKFYTASALLKAGQDLGAQMNGTPIVRQWFISGGKDSDNDGKFNRGSQRWTSMLAINVQMYVPRQTLLSLA